MQTSVGEGQKSVWPRHNTLLIGTPNERGISYLICGCFGPGSLSSLGPRTTGGQKLLTIPRAAKGQQLLPNQLPNALFLEGGKLRRWLTYFD